MSDRAIADALAERFGSKAPHEDTVTRARGERQRTPGADTGEWSIGDVLELTPSAQARALEVLAALIEESPAGRTSLSRDEVAMLARLEDATAGMDPWLLFRVIRRLLSARAAGDARGVDAVQEYLAFRAWTRDGERRYRAAYATKRIRQLLLMGDGADGVMTLDTRPLTGTAIHITTADPLNLEDLDDGAK
jgi:hypothetical protein